ncbi:hypothetical protein [Roseicella sp. DB1501]|uniref:hypothetical protein n=1 Tax=Roseicella sp. DB1501 TaxID=2730925 RepID=UPI0014932916|nr:hypothetical protein [Roseicella sp. DB1501]NOG73354.1 hypothetical protein [Roseicella sp. DB1501]
MWIGSPYQQIAGELLIAHQEACMRLTSDTAASQVYHLTRFLEYLQDRDANENGKPTASLKDLTFHTLRNFEHWLADKSVKVRRQVEERAKLLEEILANEPLANFSTKTGRLNYTKLSLRLGPSPYYVARHAPLFEIVERVASAQNVPFVRPKKLPWQSLPHQPEIGREEGRPKASRYIADIVWTVNKTLARVASSRSELFGPDFALPAPLTGSEVQRVKSKALTPVEAAAFEKSCLTAMRRVKQRFSGNRDDMAQAGGCEKELVKPHQDDLIPFLLRLTFNEHAPLNLSSALNLHIDLTDAASHCLRPSPTHGHSRLYFGKPRAGVDKTFVDVPDRGAFDIPGVIRTLIEVTQSLRSIADPKDAHSLWLYWLSRNGGVRVLTPAVAYSGLRDFVHKAENLLPDGNPIPNIHFRRFRPTVIANIAIANGVEEAQRRASHADFRRTIDYASSPGNEIRVRETIKGAQSKAITSIRSGFQDRPKREEVEALASELGVTLGHAAEILYGKRDKLCNSCIDDKNGKGPERKGTACRRFESCLVCVNGIILERHLPRLLDFYLQWLRLADEMEEVIWREEHELNCKLVEVHLSKFPRDLVDRLTNEARSRSPVIAFRPAKQS